MKKQNNGLLIAVEGIDGSGKSTLAHHLFTWLSKQCTTTVIKTREPGGSPLGAHLRTIIQESNISLSHKAEFLLFAADRAQHFQEIIIPHLNQGHVVISDRLADSSVVYQGYGRGLDIAMIKSINSWAMNNRTADLTLFVFELASIFLLIIKVILISFVETLIFCGFFLDFVINFLDDSIVHCLLNAVSVNNIMKILISNIWCS